MSNIGTGKSATPPSEGYSDIFAYLLAFSFQHNMCSPLFIQLCLAYFLLAYLASNQNSLPGNSKVEMDRGSTE